jgi:hypothetical protein
LDEDDSFGDVTGDGVVDLIALADAEYWNDSDQEMDIQALPWIQPGPLKGDMWIDESGHGVLSDVLVGEGHTPHFGNAAVMGDLNGDGYRDVAATNDAGIVVALGPIPAEGVLSCGRLLGAETDDLTPLGDVDGDGYDELYVPQINLGSGVAFGPISGVLRLSEVEFRTFVGVAKSYRHEYAASFTVRDAGDVDHDGLADVLVHDFSTLMTETQPYVRAFDGTGPGIISLIHGSDL